MGYSEDNLIVEKSFSLALEAIRFCAALEQEKKFILAKQLFRAATSIGANIREAQNAESTADFLHKMKIASKESSETAYWLDLCKHAENYPDPAGLISLNKETGKILTAIIKTTRSKSPKYQFKDEHPDYSRGNSPH